MFDPFARFYDLDYGDFAEDLVFYRELARLAGGPVLEAMCGTGRVALPLARAGLAVTGVDIAPAMIERAASRAAELRPRSRPRFLAADLLELELPERFGFAFVAINSFMHLETAEAQLAGLRRLHAHLLPGGLLALDLFNPNPAELAAADGSYVLDKTFVIPETGHRVQKFVARSVDFAAQHVDVTFCYDEIAAGGQVLRQALGFGMRWLYRFEAEHLLARAGFALHDIYGSYDLDPYTSDAPRLLVVARKDD